MEGKSLATKYSFHIKRVKCHFSFALKCDGLVKSQKWTISSSLMSSQELTNETAMEKVSRTAGRILRSEAYIRYAAATKDEA
jgi:hypothetical protein